MVATVAMGIQEEYMVATVAMGIQEEYTVATVAMGTQEEYMVAMVAMGTQEEYMVGDGKVASPLGGASGDTWGCDSPEETGRGSNVGRGMLERSMRWIGGGESRVI
jgi:hypothetical protein